MPVSQGSVQEEAAPGWGGARWRSCRAPGKGAVPREGAVSVRAGTLEEGAM